MFLFTIIAVSLLLLYSVVLNLFIYYSKKEPSCFNTTTCVYLCTNIVYSFCYSQVNLCIIVYVHVCVYVCFSNNTCTSTLCVHLYSSLHSMTELSNILIIVSIIIIMIELFGATPKLIDLNCVLFICLLVVVFCSRLLGSIEQWYSCFYGTNYARM